MMPDLGKYAEVVLMSYAVSIALLAALVVVSIARARRLRDRLDDAERRTQRSDG